jgi:hypothetical protein
VALEFWEEYKGFNQQTNSMVGKNSIDDIVLSD